MVEIVVAGVEAAEIAVETAEVAANTAVELSGEDILGDGVGENTINKEITEASKSGDLSSIANVEINGDGIGENSLNKDVAECSKPSDFFDYIEVNGDGVGESVIGDGSEPVTRLDVSPETSSPQVKEAVNNMVDVSNTIENEPRTINTRNADLAGKRHPLTGVPFVEKVVTFIRGDIVEKVKGVFPQFESVFDAQLPENMYQSPDRIQIKECNRQLKDSVETDPKLRSNFSKDQLADIKEGLTPDGYTWHHNEELGKMQLVDSNIHSLTRHTGGQYIWGGGTDNRH